MNSHIFKFYIRDYRRLDLDLLLMLLFEKRYDAILFSYKVHMICCVRTIKKLSPLISTQMFLDVCMRLNELDEVD